MRGGSYLITLYLGLKAYSCNAGSPIDGAILGDCKTIGG